MNYHPVVNAPIGCPLSKDADRPVLFFWVDNCFFLIYFKNDTRVSQCKQEEAKIKKSGFIGMLLLGLVKFFLKSLPNINNSKTRRLSFFLKFSALILYAWSQKIWVIPYSLYRSADEQNLKYQIGRTLPGKIVTEKDGFNKPSKHQNWEAGDILILDENLKNDWDDIDKYTILGLFWKRLGGTWGGDWKMKDYGHFED